MERATLRPQGKSHLLRCSCFFFRIQLLRDSINILNFNILFLEPRAHIVPTDRYHIELYMARSISALLTVPMVQALYFVFIFDIR